VNDPNKSNLKAVVELPTVPAAQIGPAWRNVTLSLGRVWMIQEIF